MQFIFSGRQWVQKTGKGGCIPGINIILGRLGIMAAPINQFTLSIGYLDSIAHHPQPLGFHDGIPQIFHLE